MKVKKILSYLMTGSIAATLVTPVNFTSVAAAVYEDGIIEKIDFENYQEGTVISSIQNFTNGKMILEGNRTDTNKYEVATDPVTGSKAFKMTKDNTETQLNMWYQLNSAKSTGAYKVSYDLRIDSASTSFGNLGSLQNNAWGNLVQPMIRGKVGFYNRGSEWWADYQGKFGKTNVHYEYIVDFDTKNINIKISNGANTVSKVYAFTQDNIEKLFFGMKSPAADADHVGWENVAENNPSGVMYIDNIIFEEYDPTVLKEINFEEYAEGADFSDSAWGLKKSEGDSITVETDPVSGSKALKLTKGATADGMYAEFGYGNSPTYSSGKLIIEYDARVASATKYFDKIGEIRNSAWSSIYGPRIKQGGLFRGDANLSFDYKDNVGYDYVKYQHILDIDNSTSTLNLYSKDGVKLLTDTIEYTKSTNNLKYIDFAISTDNTYGVNAWDAVYEEGTKVTASDNPDGVLYIDNIKISNYKFKVTGASVADGETEVLRDKEITVFYNGIVADSDVTKENFKLYKNDTLLTDYAVEKTADGTGVKFIPAEGLLYGVTYRVEALSGVKDENGVAAVKGLTRTFTTEKYIDFDLLAEWNFEDFEEGASPFDSTLVKVSQSEGDTVVVKKDEYGSKALYIERAEENLTKNSGTTLNFMLPEAVSSGTIKVTQSFRAENYRAGFSQVLSISNKSWQTTDRSYFHGGYYIPAIQGTYGYNMSAMDNTKYLTIEKYINLDTGAYDIYYYIDGVEKYKGENQTVSARKVENLTLTAAKDEWYDIYGESGAGKYYFDNIRVELLKTPEIVWTTPVSGAEGVAPSSDIILSTGAVLDASTVNTKNIVVTKGGEAVSGYSVSVSDDKNIRISFAEGMDKNSTYEISVSGLKTYGSGYEMSKAYSMSFTTADDFLLEFSKIIYDAADNTKFNFTYDFANYGVDGAVDLVFASYDASGKLIGVVTKKADAKIGEVAYGDVTLPVGDAVCFVWNGFEEMSPVCEQIVIPEIPETTYGIDNINGDEDIKIAFIGGSITEQQQWITPLKTYFNNKFAGRNVEYIVAGVGGTGSYLQQFRVYNDVIAKSPDLVIVDATINDSAVSDTCESSYENTIRQLMNASHQPAVLAVAFGSSSKTTTDESWNETYEKQAAINSYYGIPYINVQKYAEEQVAAGTYVWKATEDSSKLAITDSDGTHPNATGGALYASYIQSQLEKDFSGFIKKMTPKSEYMHESAKEYKNAREISWKDASFGGEWKIGTNSPLKFHDGSVETTVEGSSVTVTFYGKAISIYNYGGAKGMYIDYVLDGGAKKGTVSSFQNSWDFNQAGSTPAIVANEVGTHTVTFTARGTGVENAALIMGYFLVY